MASPAQQQRDRRAAAQPPDRRPGGAGGAGRQRHGLLGTILAAGARSLLVVVIMCAGSLLLWIGVPAGWLWVGSQVQAATDSIGLALAAAFVGAAVSIVALVMLLSWLNHQHAEMRARRGLDRGANPLEIVLVVTAVIAVAGFAFWFLVIAGPGPMFAPSN